MRTRWLSAPAAALFLTLGTLTPAQAGQANGHEVFTIDCEGLGTLDLSVQRSDSWGSAQIIGGDGHLTPTNFAFSLEDVTKGLLLFSGEETKGGGNANHNQETTTCTTSFSGTWQEVSEPGEPLPPGTDPTDIFQVTFIATVVAT